MKKRSVSLILLFVAGTAISSCFTAGHKMNSGAMPVVKNTDTSHLDFVAEAAPEWTDLFYRDKGWFGGDGIFSIPLYKTAASRESDSTLFIFSDTMMGEVVDGKIKKTYSGVHNTVAILKGAAPEKEDIEFYSGENEQGLPTSVFTPNTANAQARDYYWLGDGFVNRALGNKLYLFAYRMRNATDDDWSFKQEGNTIIVIPAGSTPPYKDQRQIETPFLMPASDERETGSLGAGIFVNTKEAGAPFPDGYVYVYGVRGKGSHLIAARVLPKDFENFGKWRFWGGDRWVKKMEQALDITDKVSNELSVSPLPDGRYALVFQVGGMSSKVGLRLGLTPYGPFGPVINLWDCEEAKPKNYFTYNAKAHPALSKKGELLISYNVNSFDYGNEIRKNPHLYRPRFIKIKLK